LTVDFRAALSKIKKELVCLPEVKFLALRRPNKGFLGYLFVDKNCDIKAIFVGFYLAFVEFRVILEVGFQGLPLQGLKISF
jgi:hypothetical protein